MRSDKPDPIHPSPPARSGPIPRLPRGVLLSGMLFLAAFWASGCVIHDRGHGQGRYGGPVAVQPRAAVTVPGPITFSFNDQHRHLVRDYYHHHPHPRGKKHKWKKKWKNKGRRHLPPGLAKRDVLPPGIQMQALPVDLVRQLPPPPRGAQFVYYDNQVLLVDVNTRVVLDFINISVSAGF